MAKTHYVICQQCGKRFNANNGYYYNKKSKRYVCKSCGKLMDGDKREARTGMRQSYLSMIAKIVIGLLIIVIATQPKNTDSPVAYFLFFFAIGAAVIAWGLVPFILARRRKKAMFTIRLQEEEAEEKQPDNLQKVCSNCGALVSGNYCEHCGSPLD